MKAALRRHWIRLYIRDTGVSQDMAAIAFETWWRSSFMSWCATLTAAVLISACMLVTTAWQNAVFKDLGDMSSKRTAARWAISRQGILDNGRKLDEVLQRLPER